MVSFKGILNKAGAKVDLEQAVPYLYIVESNSTITEEILEDIVTTPGCLACVPTNATIKCPHAVRNAQGAATAAHTPGVAARDAELEKMNRYGASVTPMGWKPMVEWERILTRNCMSLPIFWDHQVCVIISVAARS